MYRVYQLTEKEQGKITRQRWDGDTYYYFERDDGYKTLKLGESAILKLNSRKDSSDFRMIYFISTDRVNKLGVTKKDEVNVTMSSELVPNCLVTGAFFDGKYVYEIDGRNVYYDTNEKELKIDITTDKEVYKPGEKIKAKFLVTDSLGKPVETEMIVSAVNEATLVNTEYGNPLNYLYKERYHWPKTFVSHTVLDMGGEGGGGGEDDIREKFVDVLLFKSLATDKFGRANVEFETSDDLTSWRITGVAVDSNINAGINTKNISNILVIILILYIPFSSSTVSTSHIIFVVMPAGSIRPLTYALALLSSSFDDPSPSP